MRKSSLFFLSVFIQTLLLGCLFTHSAYRQKNDESGIQKKVLLVQELNLTDLCLFTEATYTRNPSIADTHAPFQDSPGALEHFPTGSLVTLPLTAGKKYEKRMD